MLKYTSCEGGATLRKAATDSVTDWVSTVEDKSKEIGLLAQWDVRAEFAAEWAKLSGAAFILEATRTLVLRGLFGRLPAYVGGRDSAKFRVTDVTLVTDFAISQASSLGIDFKYVLYLSRYALRKLG